MAHPDIRDYCRTPIGTRSNMKKVYVMHANRKSGTIYLLVWLTAIAVFLVGCSKDPIEIRAVLPLTGPAHNAGVGGRDGMLLAADELNARGGVTGGRRLFLSKTAKQIPSERRKSFLILKNRISLYSTCWLRAELHQHWRDCQGTGFRTRPE